MELMKKSQRPNGCDRMNAIPMHVILFRAVCRKAGILKSWTRAPKGCARLGMSLGFLATATVSGPALAATDAERIRELEERVAAQDALIRSLAARLDTINSTVASPLSSTSLPQPPTISRLHEITTRDGVTI
jgi:hypothetical protein